MTVTLRTHVLHSEHGWLATEMELQSRREAELAGIKRILEANGYILTGDWLAPHLTQIRLPEFEESGKLWSSDGKTWVEIIDAPKHTADFGGIPNGPLCTIFDPEGRKVVTLHNEGVKLKDAVIEMLEAGS